MITMLRNTFWISKPRWVLVWSLKSHLTSDMRQDMVGSIGHKETFYVFARSIWPRWILACWAVYLVSRKHKNCRVIVDTLDYIMHFKPEDLSTFTIHDSDHDVVKLLSDTSGTVFVETLVYRHRVNPEGIRLNFSKTSDLVMLKLSTDLHLEDEDAI